MYSFALVYYYTSAAAEYLVISESANVVTEWLSVLFFSMSLLRNYKMSKFETWHASAVQHKDDACVFIISRFLFYWRFIQI